MCLWIFVNLAGKETMSNRNTPISNKISALVTGRSGGAGCSGGASRVATPSGLRHRIVPRAPRSDREHTEVTKSPGAGKKQLLNDVFKGEAVANVITATTAATTAATPRFKARSTAINACYTPSSLYRNVKSTPGRADTPLGTRTSSAAKIKRQTEAATQPDDADTEVSNLTVAVRVRPFNAQECTRIAVTNVVSVQGNKLTVLAGATADATAGLTHSFTYDHVFNSSDPESPHLACQATVFEGTARPLIDRAFQGYNACLFAYGQTGSGKSYSMMGIEALDDDAHGGSTPHPEAGIIPRFCRELFEHLELLKHSLRTEIEISYFEIYNERIHDLLSVTSAEGNSSISGGGAVSGAHAGASSNTSQVRPALKVREHPIWGPYVVDLSVQPVDSYEALRNWLAVGNSQRATAATGMNDTSSRSHSIFNIVLNLTELGASNAATDAEAHYTRRSKISLVDLAGSERISTTGINCDRIREGVSINKSLLTLGKVIAALADAKKSCGSGSVFVPYRESVLTWLLRENLGGNSKTVMLATISPASVHIEETLATLRYACQARSIVNRVKVNESPHDKIIRELRAEVDRLKSLRNEYERQRRLSANSNPAPRKIIIETSVDESEVEALRQQLAERERELSRAQKSWMQRLKEAEDQRKSELRLLRRKGLALELSADQKQACLVNLTADPIFSGTLFYLLPPGIVKIGRTRTSAYCSQPDIVLDGPLVGYHHCIIENDNGKLFITPQNEDFETYLNGDLVSGQQQMFHGDRLVIGGSHYFRISNPFCSRRDRKMVVDFKLAHEEILRKQEEKLRRELEEEKRAALSRIEFERVENERNFNDRMQKLELEQLKYKCNREILEEERKALEQEVATRKCDDTPEVLTYTPSFKSTLLDDIKSIMENPSEDSLHKTQLMVKEATQHCRNLGLNLEFRQSQVLDEFGMFHAVVLILDKEHERKAEWPTARLGVWLDIVRVCDNLNADNVFSCVDINWEPLEDDLNETLSDSLNSSRISLNLSVVKDVFLKQPLKKLPRFFSTSSASSSNKSPAAKKENLAKSALLNSTQLQRNTKKKLTYEETESSGTPLKSVPLTNAHASEMEASFATQASAHVRDLQRTALQLRKLCDAAISERENLSHAATAEQQQIREALTQLENLLQGMRCCLDHNILSGNGALSPTKTPKSVRFLID